MSVQCSRARRARRKSCFTLVEMLAVLLIVSILLGISITAWQKATEGFAVKAASQQIGAIIHLARQESQANRAYIAVIMPGSEIASIPANRRYRSMRTAIVTRTSESVYKFAQWTSTSKWNYIPSGSAIMEVDNYVGIEDNGVPTKNPKDNLVTEVTDVDFGAVMGGGNSGTTGVRAIVFSSTGKRRGYGQYVTVGDASVNIVGTTEYWEIRNAANTATNKSSANQITLVINQFSGEVTFITPDKY